MALNYFLQLLERHWWLIIVLSSLVIQLVSTGVPFSVGVLNVEFLKQFGDSRATTAWISSINIACVLGLGPIPAYFLRWFTHRQVVCSGVIIAFVGYSSCYFANSIVALCLLYGVVGGLGGAMMYLPSAIIVGYYFNEYRSIMTALTSTGIWIGLIVLPIFLTTTINVYTWRGAVLLLGALYLQTLVFAACLREPQIVEDIVIEEGETKAIASTGNDIGFGSVEMKDVADYSCDPVNGNSMRNRCMNGDKAESMNGGNKDGSMNGGNKDGSVNGGNKDGSVNGSNKDGSLESVHDQLEEVAVDSRDSHVCFVEAVVEGSADLTASCQENCKVDRYAGEVKDGGMSALVMDDIKFCEIDVADGLLMRNQENKRDSVPTNKMKVDEFLIQPKDRYEKQNSENTEKLLAGYANKVSVEVSKNISPANSALKDYITVITDFNMGIYFLSNVFWNIGTVMVAVFTTDYMIKISGASLEDAAACVTATGCGGIFGGIIAGGLGNSKHINVVVLYSVICVIGGVIPLLFLTTSNYYALIALNGFYGASFGGMVGLLIVVTTYLFNNMRLLGIAFGYLMIPNGIGTFIGPPLGGYLFDVTGSYHLTFWVSGIVTIISGVVMVLIPLKSRWVQSRSPPVIDAAQP